VTADLSRRLSSMDFLDDDDYVQLDRWGNRAALTQVPYSVVSIPVVFAGQVVRAPEAVRSVSTDVRCLIGSWMRRRTDWHTY
jgi:hypothetical protein